MIPMGFRGAATGRSIGIYADIADSLNAEPAAVEAVVLVEAGGRGFLADKRPKILFERHKFHKFTGGLYSADHPDISNSKAGGYLGGASEYDRLDMAIDLDRDAALRSASWGLPQIMGFNATPTGFDTVDGMIEAFCQGEDDQLWGFSRFVKSIGLDDEIRDKRWTEFAIYNGTANIPAYSRKLVAAFAEVLHRSQDDDIPAGRAEIAEAQAILVLLGYDPLSVDGWMGPKTEAAVRRFQTDHGLKVDGVVGVQTRAALFGDVPKPALPPAN